MISNGIKLSQNRFAVLSKDPDSDLKASKKNKEQGGQYSGNHSQTKTHKKGSQPNKTSAIKQPQQKQKKKDNSKGAKNRTLSTTSLPDNDEWERRDQDLVEKLFHNDMCQAIELSKQEFEKQKQIKQDKKSSAKSKVSINSSSGQKSNDRDPHKEKKQKSTKTISLKEFQHHVEKSLPLKNDNAAKSPASIKSNSNSEHNGAGDYFSNINDEVTQIERKERKKENKRILHESIKSGLSLASVFDNERTTEKLNEKDKRIEELEKELQSWKDKFHHVKKRNQQLLVMLQQGEMKEKAELLLEVERLSVIRDELTSEVTELHESLEKERSKVSKLKEEIQATSRHKK